MGEKTKIEWCDKTFNPWRGCLKCATGCQNCYAEATSKRNQKTLGVWGSEKSGATRVVASEDMWAQPFKWNEAARRYNIEQGFDEYSYGMIKRPRVFCASLADIFEDWKGPMIGHWGQDPNLWGWDQPVRMVDVRARLFALVRITHELDWLLLTKRPENIPRFMPVRPFKNVWLGTSIACQDDIRNADILSESRRLCAKTFLSIEPLIGPVDVTRGERPDWLIIGGESGPNARPCNVDWIRDIVQSCKTANVPVFVKQLGSFPFKENQRTLSSATEKLPRIKLADRKGGYMDEWPEDLRIREFPR